MWSPLNDITDVAVAELMPVAGTTGAVFALTSQSRTPLALGSAPMVTDDLVVAEAAPNAMATAATTLAWIVAGLAALALFFAASDLRKRQSPLIGPMGPTLADSAR